MNFQVLDAIRQFEAGQLVESNKTLTAHYQIRFGASPFRPIDYLEIHSCQDESNSWERFFLNLYENFGNGSIRISLFISVLWEALPTQLLLDEILALHSRRFLDGDEFEVESSYNGLCLFELFDLIRHAVCHAEIELASTKPSLVIPTIVYEKLERIRRQKYLRFWSLKIVSALELAIEKGAAPRPILVDQPWRTQTDAMVIQVFGAIFFPTSKSIDHHCLEIFRPMTSKKIIAIVEAIRAFRYRFPSETELSDFIFAYSGGRVLTEDPTSWLSQFARSIEEGKIRFTV